MVINLGSARSENACKVTLQTVPMNFKRRTFLNIFPVHFYVELSRAPLLVRRSTKWCKGHSLNNLQISLSEAAGIELIKHIHFRVEL